MLDISQLVIVSGGQTGADRAALDFALQHGIPHGGWCPNGRRAEDGPISDIYQLEETPSRRYEQRTKWNVRDSDATVVMTISRQAIGGSGLTLGVARSCAKPHLHLAKDSFRRLPLKNAAESLKDFLAEHQVRRLNVAGPRASQEPNIAAFVHQVLSTALSVGHDIPD